MNNKAKRILFSGIGVCVFFISATAFAAGSWDDGAAGDKKTHAIRNVVRYFLGLDDKTWKTESEYCLENRTQAHDFFIKHGKLEIPPGAKVTFLPAGDIARERGSLLLELPTAEASDYEPRRLLDAYVIFRESIGNGNPAGANTSRRWDDLDDRAAAIADVLKYVARNQDEKSHCLEDDGFSGYVKSLFSRTDLGKINPPANIKIVFLPTGQHLANTMGSLVIQVPARPKGITDDEGVSNTYTASCYKYWKPEPPSSPQDHATGY